MATPAASEKPPEKTARRATGSVRTRATGRSSSRASREGCRCRGSAVRRALFNSVKRSRNAAATCSRPSVAALAAANSMASGMPSSWRQIAAIVGRLSTRDEKSAPSSLALAMKSSGALWPRIWSGPRISACRDVKRGHAICVSPVIRNNFAARG